MSVTSHSNLGQPQNPMIERLATVMGQDFAYLTIELMLSRLIVRRDGATAEALIIPHGIQGLARFFGQSLGLPSEKAAELLFAGFLDEDGVMRSMARGGLEPVANRVSAMLSSGTGGNRWSVVLDLPEGFIPGLALLLQGLCPGQDIVPLDRLKLMESEHLEAGEEEALSPQNWDDSFGQSHDSSSRMAAETVIIKPDSGNPSDVLIIQQSLSSVNKAPYSDSFADPSHLSPSHSGGLYDSVRTQPSETPLDHAAHSVYPPGFPDAPAKKPRPDYYPPDVPVVSSAAVPQPDPVPQPGARTPPGFPPAPSGFSPAPSGTQPGYPAAASPEAVPHVGSPPGAVSSTGPSAAGPTAAATASTATSSAATAVREAASPAPQPGSPRVEEAAEPRGVRDLNAEEREKLRRQNQRLKHSIPAQIEYVEKTGKRRRVKAQLVDISVSGLCLHLPDKFDIELAPRSPVQIELVRRRDRLKWPGRVARVFEGEKGEKLLGVQFDQRRYEVVTSVASHKNISLVIAEPAS